MGLGNAAQRVVVVTGAGWCAQAPAQPRACALHLQQSRPQLSSLSAYSFGSMAATVDAHVTVGFFVKDTVSPYHTAKAGSCYTGTPEKGDAAEQPSRREEGARGLLRLSSFSVAPTPSEWVSVRGC